MFSSAVTAENAKQAIKTAIAGVLAIYITSLFRLPEGYWAAFSALIVMQSNVGATLSASRTRLAGTAVGAVVGGAFRGAVRDATSWPSGSRSTIAFFICNRAAAGGEPAAGYRDGGDHHAGQPGPARCG